MVLQGQTEFGRLNKVVSIDDAKWRQFVNQFNALVVPAGAADTQLGQALYHVVQCLERPDACVVFAGLFSVGKSSVINFGIRQRLLPTSDLAETGAACVLRRGPRDEITVHEVDGKQRPIPFTTVSISREISIRTPEGPLNARVGRVNRLDIRLAKFPYSDAVCWVDSPGRNSGPETERALRIAESADILVWVLKSGQFVAEKDVEHIGNHVARHGPGSVVVVLNVFLDVKGPQSDIAALWERFRATSLAGHIQRLRDRLGAMNFPPAYMPPTIVMSAEDGMGNPTQFGGADFQRLMTDLNAADAPMIRRARLGKAAGELERAIGNVAAIHGRISAENRAQEKTLATQHLDNVQKHTRSFRMAVRTAVDEFVASFSAVAKSAGEAIADGNTSTYSDRLNAKLDAVFGSAFTTLQDRINTASVSLGFGRLTTAQFESLRAKLGQSKVTVTTADSAVDAKPVVGYGALGAIVGSCIFPGVGTVIGAGLGSLFGGTKAKFAALEQSAKVAKESAIKAGRDAADAMLCKATEAIDHVLGVSRHCPALPVPPAQQDREQSLKKLLNSMMDLHRTAAAWSKVV